MAIKNGDFIRLNFTGTIEETGDVFDTTIGDIAEEAGIAVEEKQYIPIPIIVGGKHLLPAIDEAVIGMESGDTKTVEVDPENGFGERNKELITLIPLKEFKKQGMDPHPGMKITSDGQTGKILTVSGGRVKVDFNHDLAGKHLKYELEITEIIEDDEEKIKSMIELHYAYPNFDINKTVIKIDGNEVSIKLDDITKFDQKSYMDVTFARFRIAKDIWDNMDFEKVQFVDEFEKKTEDTLGLETEESEEVADKEE